MLTTLKFCANFLTNVLVTTNKSLLRSFYCVREITLTAINLQVYLKFSTTKDSTHLTSFDFRLNNFNINLSFGGTRLPCHKFSTNSLLIDAYVIQHILRTNVIQKVSDHIHLIALLSMNANFILS